MKKIVIIVILCICAMSFSSCGKDKTGCILPRVSFSFIYENQTDVPVSLEWYNNNDKRSEEIPVDSAYIYIYSNGSSNKPMDDVMNSDSARMVFAGQKELWFYRIIKSDGVFGSISEESGEIYLIDSYEENRIANTKADYKFIIDKSLYDRAVEIEE